jgi:hypothetical protein
VVATVTTDALGSATRLAASGSMVTVVLGTELSPKLVTVMGVQPGDLLTAIDDTGSPPPVANVSVTPPASPPMGTIYYDVKSGNCGTFGSAVPVTYGLYGGCEIGGKFPVLAVPLDSAYKSLGQFAFQKGISTVGDGGTAQANALSAWAPSGSVALSASPASGTAYVSLGYSEIADGVAHGLSQSVQPAMGAATATFETHPGYPDAVQYEVGLNGPFLSMGQALTYIAKRTSAPADTTLDASQLLPMFTNATIDTTTPTRPSATLTMQSPPANVDGATVVLQWNASTEAGFQYGSWVFVAPPPSTVFSVSAPALPPSLASWAPTGTAMQVGAIVVGSDHLAGYDGLRATFGALPSPAQIFSGSVVVPPLPSNQTVRLSVLASSPM